MKRGRNRFKFWLVLCAIQTGTGPAWGSASAQSRPSPVAEELWDDSRILVTADAVLLDQKRLQPKYLRVRVQRRVILLDGFVRNREEESLCQEKLGAIEGVKKVFTSCVVVEGLGKKPDYETRFSEPARDLLTAGRVRTELLKACRQRRLAPDVHIVAVDVFKGDAQVYAVVPNPDEAAKITGIALETKGVTGCQTHGCPAAKEQTHDILNEDEGQRRSR